MPYVGKRVGIVGATSYLGRHLVKRLLDDNQCELRLFSRNTRSILDQPVYALDRLEDQFKGLDCVIHLAAITDNRVPEGEMRQVNLNLALAVAEAGARANVSRFVFLSSIGVHGKSSPKPVGPGSSYRPENAYARSKVAAERALAALSQKHDFELTTLRPPMIYGPSGTNSFAQLARLLKTGMPLPFAAARGLRSFCSVENAISAIIHSAVEKEVSPVLIPADPEDFDTVALIGEMARAMEQDVRLWPLSKSLLAIPLGLVGQRDMVTSLFEPLQVDRAHWQEQKWRPLESGIVGVRRALLDATE